MRTPPQFKPFSQPTSLIFAWLIISLFLFTQTGCSLFTQPSQEISPTQTQGTTVTLNGTAEFPVGVLAAPADFSSLKIFANFQDGGGINSSGTFRALNIKKEDSYLLEVKNSKQTTLLKGYLLNSDQTALINSKSTAIAKIFQDHQAVDPLFSLSDAEGKTDKISSISLDIERLLKLSSTPTLIPPEKNDITALIIDVLDPLFKKLTLSPRALTSLLTLETNELIGSASVELKIGLGGTSQLSLSQFNSLPPGPRYQFTFASSTTVTQRLYGLDTGTLYWARVNIQDPSGNIGSNTGSLASFTTESFFGVSTSSPTFKLLNSVASGSMTFNFNEEITSYTLQLSSGSFTPNPTLFALASQSLTASITAIVIDFPRLGSEPILVKGSFYNAFLKFQHGLVKGEFSGASFTGP